MKAMKNIEPLGSIITTDDWQRAVYASTGVIPVPANCNITLVSNCGSVDLDFDG